MGKNEKSPYIDREMSQVIRRHLRRKHGRVAYQKERSVKAMCPHCFNNTLEDLVRLRPDFYYCRRCGAEFIADEPIK